MLCEHVGIIYVGVSVYGYVCRDVGVSVCGRVNGYVCRDVYGDVCGRVYGHVCRGCVGAS